MADRVNQQLGNYRLVRLLGRGGFAEVYLGEHLRLKTQAAIKVLHTSLENDDVENFLREAQTIGHLKHPHIVRVFDFDVENHTPFLVMGYLPNGNVRNSYPKGTLLPLVSIVSYVKQIASALQYAHDRKLIHRDIKPENMLLDRDEIIVLSDFGIALMAQSSRYQSTQEVAGTAAYMAPEQFQGKPRRASDQYALGVVTYEWLSGDRPFHGSFSEIASQHLFVPPPPLHNKVPTISPEVAQVVMKALEKDPHKRFASVQEFATALQQACHVVSADLPAMSLEITHTNHPTLLSDAVTSSGTAYPTNVVTPQGLTPQSAQALTPPSTSTPAKTSPAAYKAEPGSMPNSHIYEKTPPASKPGSDIATISRRWTLSMSRTALLVGLALIVIVGSVELFSFIKANQISTGNAPAALQSNQANATAQANDASATSQADNATGIAQAATATATILANLPTPTPSNPVLVPTPTSPNPVLVPTPTPPPTQPPTLPANPTPHPTITTDCGHLVTPWVALYQYPNFGGRELCFEGTGLINLSDYGFDMQTQSINIAANGYFYDQPDAQGNELGFYYADEQADLGNWDNRISSILVVS
jgi:serine/threonine protein kinase